jgi:hypothetical protein
MARIGAALLATPLLLAASAALGGEPLSTRIYDRGALESALRSESGGELYAPRIAAGPDQGSPFNTQAIGRVKHGAFSLLVPGWSQWRSGNNKRAIFFAATEAVVWSTWIFSELQSSSREDQYVEFAQQFAQVDSGDHADDYWRGLASYRDSDDFNADIRADIRAGLQPESSLIASADAWRWQSERRFREFQKLRGGALSAQDRADFIIVFALINRVVAFVDAVRTGPATDESGALSMAPPEPKTWKLDVRPNLADPSARFSYQLRF